MAVTAEVRVYSAEYCDKTFARKGGAGGGAAPVPAVDGLYSREVHL